MILLPTMQSWLRALRVCIQTIISQLANWLRLLIAFIRTRWPWLVGILLTLTVTGLMLYANWLSWLGLDWLDILINVVVLAIIPGFVAAYGGHLAAEAIDDKNRSRKVKLCFWGLFVFGMIVTFWQQFRAAEADLGRTTKDAWAEILLSNKFPPPSAPTVSVSTKVTPKARMEFIFYGKDDLDGFPVKEISLPAQNLTISLSFSVRVVGDVIPRDGALWITICDLCTFAGNMPGFLSDKDAPRTRSIGFRLLYTGGVTLPRMAATVGFPAGTRTLPFHFYYGCANCNPINVKKPQVLSVKVIYPTP